MIGTFRHRFCFALSVALSLLALQAGCKRETSTTAAPEHAPQTPAVAPLPRTTVALNGQPFSLEIAATEADRNRGLMYRKSLPAEAGMIFIFRDEKPLSFWMHNTLIPLDIVYLDSQCRIVSIKQMKPMDDSPVPSEGPARIAIELNVGTAARIGLKPGDLVSVPKDVQNPPNLE